MRNLLLIAVLLVVSSVAFVAANDDIEALKDRVFMESSHKAPKQPIKITQPAALRLTPQAHTDRFNRFIQLHNKVYSSPALKKQAFNQFSINRRNIVALNDKHGKGYAIFSSRSPFADIAPSVFTKRNNLKPSPYPRFSMKDIVVGDGETNLLENAPSCKLSTGQIGSCVDTSVCAKQGGVPHKGLCHGPSSVQCCTSGTGSVVGGGDAVVKAGPPCSANGQSGTCIPSSSCTGTVYSGKCAGAANIKCCVPSGGDGGDGGDDDSQVACDQPTMKCMGNAPGGCGVNFRFVGMCPAAKGGGFCCIDTRKHVSGTFAVDYRSQLTTVKNQGDCGSCWAHAASEVLESFYIRKGMSPSILAPQQLVDCDKSIPQQGCNGGSIGAALNWYQSNSPVTVDQYPYNGKDNACTAPTGTLPKVTNYQSKYCTITANETCEPQLLDSLKSAGPIAVALDGDGIQFYDGGIMPATSCNPGKLSHAVVAVGYGSENGKDFWLIRNSWDVSWGEDGFIRIEANVNGACGIGKTNYWVTSTADPAPASQ